MIYSVDNLANSLRSHCDGVKHRVWISAPFIGELKDVLRIIGSAWKRSDIDFKVITDIETGFIRKNTYNEFVHSHHDCIKSLKSLHAKVYVVDDWCLITSANLTGTAFSKRYEVGVDSVDIHEAEAFFMSIWDNPKARIITSWKKGKKQNQFDFEDGQNGYDLLNKLPRYSAETQRMDRYHEKCSRYIEFAEKYNQITGRCQAMVKDGFTLLQEVDYLFNYLEHEDGISKSLDQVQSRKSSEQSSLVKRYFKKISNHYSANRERELRRVESAKLVKRLTSSSKIKTITAQEARMVLDTFNCFGLGTDMHGHASQFLRDNTLADIRTKWDELLNNGEITAEKVSNCCQLRHFGKSSVSELIAWRFPDTYPIMNTCSKKGLWFFGVDV